MFPWIALALIGLALWTHVWILAWPGAVLIATAIVYLRGAPRALGKRDDGTMAAWAWAAWAPLFAYMRIAHELARYATSESVGDEVAPGIWVGRRARLHELPPEIALVVDLCAELPEAPGVVQRQPYLLVRALDETAPQPRELAAAVDAILAARGPVFIHCAFGHGRSAAVAAAVLVRRGDATLADVEAKLRARRPKIGLNRLQRERLAEAVALGTDASAAARAG
mgnify:CR=1 FL=1